MTTPTGSPAIEDVTPLDPCDVPARLGSLILGHCTKLQGHEGAHSAPLDRVTWETEAQQLAVIAALSAQMDEAQGQNAAAPVVNLAAPSSDVTIAAQWAQLTASFRDGIYTPSEAVTILHGRYLESDRGRDTPLDWSRVEVMELTRTSDGHGYHATDVRLRVPLAATEVKS